MPIYGHTKRFLLTACRGFFPEGVYGKINSSKGYNLTSSGTDDWPADAVLATQVVIYVIIQSDFSSWVSAGVSQTVRSSRCLLNAHATSAEPEFGNR